jgi:hypothetical protein
VRERGKGKWHEINRDGTYQGRCERGIVIEG